VEVVRQRFLRWKPASEVHRRLQVALRPVMGAVGPLQAKL
jgi:hypothetical protein